MASTMLRGLARPAARAPRAPQLLVRRKSGPYGYTQAKALVFSKNGEPSEVLKYDSLRRAFDELHG